MKTIRYITAIMMILLMGIPPTQAQSTRRKADSEHKERVSAHRKTTQVNTERKAVNQRRPATNHQVQRAKQVQPTRQAQKSQVQRAKQVQPQQTRQARQNQQVVREVRKPVSISTRNNPKSTYREPKLATMSKPIKRSAAVNSYSSKRYYGGNHYHYAYPTRKVKVHHHYDTYLNNYHVLYYPTYTSVYWTRSMYRDYRRWYPNYYWNYNYGYRIQTISAFDAKYNLGEVAMVYGRVYATWYNRETNDYLLFFGGEYPYHQFSVVLPATIARKFSWRPERFFLGEHITITGLITTFEGVPEIIVKNKRQLGLY